MNELLEDSTEAVGAGFECDIVILGMIASIYGKYSTLCPVRGFGGDIDNRQVYDNATKLWYSVGNERREGRNGVSVSIRETTATPPIKQMWIPFEALRSVYVEFKEAAIVQD